MLWLMRGLVINGLTFYAATLTGDCIVGLATIMIYQESFGQTPPALKGRLLYHRLVDVSPIFKMFLTVFTDQ